jgi:hypothetical protein
MFHNERGIFVALWRQRADVARVVVADGLNEVEIAPATLLREGELPLDR